MLSALLTDLPEPSYAAMPLMIKPLLPLREERLKVEFAIFLFVVSMKLIFGIDLDLIFWVFPLSNLLRGWEKL